MQVIVVKYHPQTGVHHARYSATSSSGVRVYVESESAMSPEGNQDAAVRKLCDKLHWGGILIRGGQLGKSWNDGFVYVWESHGRDGLLTIRDTRIEG